MDRTTKNQITRLLFYWFTSFLLATSIYYLLWLIMPKHYVFGFLYRMFLYHYENPIQYILIPCFFYGIIATLLLDEFAKRKTRGQIFLTLRIIFLTILLSLPFGGMLWHYHDMQAGFFPINWFDVMVKKGFFDGIAIGWLIIILSIPYNIIGLIICFFLTRIGSKLFR